MEEAVRVGSIPSFDVCFNEKSDNNIYAYRSSHNRFFAITKRSVHFPVYKKIN